MSKDWYQKSESKLGKWQRELEERSGSSTFCILPWIHMATRPNGDMRICCVANASGADTGEYDVGLVKEQESKPVNFQNTLPSEAFNNDYMKATRKAMLDGKIPASCTKCFAEEKKGIVSKRIWETGTWIYEEDADLQQLIEDTTEDGKVPEKIQYFDLRLGHTCNLKCVMCSPHDSSRWVPDHKKLYDSFKSKLIKKQMSWDGEEFNNKWHENPKFWEEIFSHIPHIKQLYFAGGEPLMIKEHRKFLEEIINRGYAYNISLRYNSNGILVDDDIISIWSHFKKVKYGISLDALGERVEYIRYPTDWKKVEKNIWKLEKAPANITTSIALAVQVLNIKHIPDFIKWKVRNNFKKLNFDKNAAGQTLGGGLVSVHLVWIPTWLSLKVLPKEDKEEVRQLFNDLKTWLWNNYTKDDEFWHHNPYGWQRWESILDWMDSEDHTDLLPDFKEYITKLDNVRNTKFAEVFPELQHLV